MIPKVIHYFWFGGAALPPIVLKCIQSWKKHMPDYEIKKWDESNFDINQIPYIREAYKAKKWAYVSDYARIKVLYEEGGVYLDTDVELIKSLNDLIAEGPFMACERRSNQLPYPGVNTGLGFAVYPRYPILKQILEYYEKINFDNISGSLTTVEHVTSVLIKNGLQPTLEKQKIDDLTIYPSEYFCPFDDKNRVAITTKTVAIHHYAGSWLGIRHKIKKRVLRFFGPNVTFCLVQIKSRLKDIFK